MSIYKEKPLDRSGLKTVPLGERPAQASLSQFARPYAKGEGVLGMIESMPRLQAGENFRAAVEAVRRAWDMEKPILWGLGEQVVEAGLGPTLIDLMERGFVNGVAMHGAAALRDFEVALVGSTGEDVETTEPGSRSGMAEETGAWMNQAICAGDAKEIGIGEALGEFLLGKVEEQAQTAQPSVRFPDASILLQAYRRRIPVTVHVAIGTDAPHNHPLADGRAIGGAAHRDFLLFSGMVASLGHGGVYLNVGSAKLLPEVFRKAVAAARNILHSQERELDYFTTVSLNFLQPDGTIENGVRRPEMGESKQYALGGHPEILLPLLAAALVEGE